MPPSGGKKAESVIGKKRARENGIESVSLVESVLGGRAREGKVVKEEGYKNFGSRTEPKTPHWSISIVKVC
jgi:hypothetical protein